MSKGRRLKKGFTLIEMMVTLAIMSVVMVGIFKVFDEGMQLFRTNSRAADAQTAAIKVMSLISAELVNATPEVSQNYESGSGNLPGIVFATSLTDTGATRFDDITGQIYWQRYICYYFVADPSGNHDGKLFRAELPIPDDAIRGGPGNRDVNTVVKPFVRSTTTNVFAADSDAKKRLIADGVSGFDVTIYDGREGGNTAGAKDVVFDITVEAGNPASQNVRNGYYIKVGSRVAPRG